MVLHYEAAHILAREYAACVRVRACVNQEPEKLTNAHTFAHSGYPAGF